MSVPRSLVLITIDCLRADHAGFLGYQPSTTSFLDSLAPKSMVMHNAIVAGAPTYYSFPPIMASRYPLALGRDVIGLCPGEATIASVVKQSGYATAAFVAGNPYLSQQFGYSTGFDAFSDFLDSETASLPEGEAEPVRLRSRLSRLLATASHKLGPAGELYDEVYFRYCQWVADATRSFDELRRFPSAEIIVDRACAWLAEAGQRPFFLWLHFMDPHSPYYPKQAMLDLPESKHLDASRARYLNSFWSRGDVAASRLQKRREEVISLYDAGVRWVDTQIARLVDTLRASGDWANCVFALTADHGEEFLDHGGRYHAPVKLGEELIRVPLLVHAPQVKQGQVVDSVFSLLHLAPTLLDAMDLPIPGSFRGQSHWRQLPEARSGNETAIIECVAGCTNPVPRENRLGRRVLGIREKRYKLVLDFAASAEQMFDLRDDPAELHPLRIDEEKPVRKRLLRAARRHLAESTQSLDPEQRLSAQLRDLQLELAHS